MRIALLAAAMALAAPALSQTADHVVTLKTGEGKPAGTVTLVPAPNGVLLKVAATGLTPGWHAIHFHEKGGCSDAAFKSAGGHVHGATPVVHGLLNASANDAGDLPNIHAGKDGAATAELFTTLVSFGGTGQNLADADGSAIVIHAKADDYMTQPIGGAGDRVACGIVK